MCSVLTLMSMNSSFECSTEVQQSQLVPVQFGFGLPNVTILIYTKRKRHKIVGRILPFHGAQFQHVISGHLHLIDRLVYFFTNRSCEIWCLKILLTA